MIVLSFLPMLGFGNAPTTSQGPYHFVPGILTSLVSTVLSHNPQKMMT